MAKGKIDVAKPKDDDDVTLIVAQRSGKRLKGFRISLSKDVADALRAACTVTVDRLNEREPIPFTSDISYDPKTQYLEVPSALLTATATTTAKESSQGGTVETDPEAHSVLQVGTSLPLLKAPALKNQTFVFYAALIGSDPSDRDAFVTKWNPYRSGMAGNILTSFGNSLKQITDPLMIFKPEFDMVVTSKGIAVLDKDAFDQVFRDIDAMRERVPAWADHVAAALPLSDESLGCLQSVCIRNARVAAKARSLFESGVLTNKKLTAGALAKEMRNQKLDADRMIQGKLLVIQESDVANLLKLLDESLWVGWLTTAAWEAGSKSKRA